MLRDRSSSIPKPRIKSQEELNDANDDIIIRPRHQLSLNLDVKRLRPMIAQYTSSSNVPSFSISENSNNEVKEEIVPSLGLHMLQTGSISSNKPCQSDQSHGLHGVRSHTQNHTNNFHNQFCSKSDKRAKLNLAETSASNEQDKVRIQTKKGKEVLRKNRVRVFLLIILLQSFLLFLVFTSQRISLFEGRITRLSDGMKGHLTVITSLISQLREKIESSIPKCLSKIVTTNRIDQLQTRLKLGQSLLQKWNDPSGANAACLSVTNTLLRCADNVGVIFGEKKTEELKHYVLASIPLLNNEENIILSKALLCMGEAEVAFVVSSTLAVGSTEARWSQLVHAKNYFEAANYVDPTNPATRAGLGLTYLLLGEVTNLMEESESNDTAMQYIAQSIMHLNTALELTNTTEHESTNFMEKSILESDSEEEKLVHLAAMHNLGLAYLLLDSINVKRSKTGIRNMHYLEWISTLQSLEQSHILTHSFGFLINGGVMLLETKRIKEAISSMKAMFDKLSCSNNDSYHQRWNTLESGLIQSSSRRNEMCFLLNQNLAIAEEMLNDDLNQHWDDAATTEQSPLHLMAENISILHNFSEVYTTPESVPGKGNEIDRNFIDTILNAKEREAQLEHIQDLAHSNESHSNTPRLGTDTEEHIFSMDSKPDFQNILVALEKAIADGEKCPRLLLVLSKARASKGDISGAIDAILIAVQHSTTMEETEILTNYLESLIDKLSDRGEVATQHEKTTINAACGPSTHINDYKVSELEMKLEIERLKYRVLEQEYALKYQDFTRDHLQEHNINAHVIDYQQNLKVIPQTTFNHLISNVDSDDEQKSKNVNDVNEIDTISLIASDKLESMSHTEIDHVEHTSISVLPENVATSESLKRGQVQNISYFDTSLSVTDHDESNEILQVENLTVVEKPLVKLHFNEPITLPKLYQPSLQSPLDISASAKSYMKIADAYLEKGNYALASKQFLKVIKKAPDHLAAHLGYATALERAGKVKQINDVALAYVNASKIAIIQGEKINPLQKAGAGGRAESILRRALKIAQTASNDRLQLLKTLSLYAHTAALAADLYYAIGMEMMKEGSKHDNKKVEAKMAFSIANEFMILLNDTQIPFHGASIIELGKISFEQEENPMDAMEWFMKAKKLPLGDSEHVKLLVLSGRAYSSMGELDLAISDFVRALSFPQCSFTASAHHELALALTKNKGDKHEINSHFEKALDMGMDPTNEAILALGEHNISVMRGLNRLHWKSFNDANNEETSRGVIGGGGVGTQNSVFAPIATKDDVASAQPETLALLESGAAAYDGHIPMGGEIEGTGSNLANLSGRKKSENVNINKK